MYNKTWLRYAACFATSGASAGWAGAFLYDSIGWAKLTPSDWGTWVGAFGTAGTLMGAIWLAHRDARIREHDARSTAIIHAANMQHRLQELRLRVEKICKDLSEYSGVFIPEDVVRGATKNLNALPKFTSEEVVELVPLGMNCALKLAGVQSALGNTIGIINKVQFFTPAYTGAPRYSGVDWDQMSLPIGIIERQNARLWDILKVVHDAVKSAE
ncbi:hypothetical protein [Pseudoduganella aquatica]|uniref:hypothetical protein n=1 Tax=Pseudoduganella aquatica TaxID=2660641 RepID=UPI001E4DADA1|nr:hypothetical protein [Pseudoduganella aquatica]